MIPNSSLIVSTTEPQGNNRKKVWMQKGKNRFNSYLATFADNSCIHSIESSNKVILTATNVWARTQCEISNLKSNTKYAISSLISNPNGNRAGLYESETNRNISSSASFKSTLIITSDSNGVVTFQMWANWSPTSNNNSVTFDEIQIEQNPTATDYEDYIEPAIYIKNSNDVYEEFIKKEENKTIKSDFANINIPSSSSPFYIGNPVIMNRKGTIMVTANISFSNNGSGYRQAGLALNGTTDVQTALIGATNTASMAIQSVGILDVNQGDTIQMIAKQNSGSDLTLWARLRIKYI